MGSFSCRMLCSAIRGLGTCQVLKLKVATKMLSSLNILHAGANLR